MLTRGYPDSTESSLIHKPLTVIAACDQPSTTAMIPNDWVTIVEGRLHEQRQRNKELKREIAVLRALGRYSPDGLRMSYPYTPSNPPAYSVEMPI